ncbi:aromatic acid exporter family protein [Brachybacterium sp. YJGR34]|uniref:FUSC family protein n=1 Tax=Brachybacterium sp. YJGR34 TaxID=2059911 RepID=UPI001E3ED946|nr:aromatic acid exporter family protein [Brachybacterium sp. YJGR34]
MRSPDVLTGALQMLKSVAAATLAWWLSIAILDSQLPFLAPWVALLTVHATVYRSVRHGLQTTVASALGVGLSFLVGALLGVHLWSFALALLVGLLVAKIPGIREEGVAVATTAIFVLGSGFGEQAPLLEDRILEVALGVGVGVAVNLVVVPPLRDRQAAQTVDSINRRMGAVLTEMADEFGTSWDDGRAEAWFAETGRMRDELDAAWQTVRVARESERGNPRRRLRRGRPAVDSSASYEEILGRVDEGVSHLRHLARTLREAASADEVSSAETAWGEDFRQRWVAILRDTGHALEDPDAEVEPIADRLDELAAEISSNGALPARAWPLYGSLLASTRHIAVIVDDVASARAAREEERTNPAS